MYLPADQFTEKVTPVQPWADTLAYGDIVSFRFPVNEEDGVKPKARPCLVLDVEDRDGLTFVTLAYGTSVGGTANRGYEIRVNRAEDIEAAGLDRPTRFVGARRITVSTAHSGFRVNRQLGTAVIGQLSGSAFDRMNRVRARIHAERDIAAHYRCRTAAEREEDRRLAAALLDRINSAAV